MRIPDPVSVGWPLGYGTKTRVCAQRAQPEANGTLVIASDLWSEAISSIQTGPAAWRAGRQEVRK